MTQTIEKNEKIKTYLFEKNKIDIFLGRWEREGGREMEEGREEREREIANMNGEWNGNVSLDPKYKKKCYEHFYAIKFDKLDEVGKFLEIHNLPELREEI